MTFVYRNKKLSLSFCQMNELSEINFCIYQFDIISSLVKKDNINDSNHTFKPYNLHVVCPYKCETIKVFDTLDTLLNL